MKLNKTYIFITVVLLLISFIAFFIEQPKEEIINTPSTHTPTEKIPLYYNLDEPTKVYTRDGENFKEISITNG